MQYEIMPSVTLSQLETRIREVFSIAKCSKMTSMELHAMLHERITEPLNYRTPSGKRRHSVWLCGYAAGVIAQCREDIWRNEVEFCYLVDGVLYSTHKDSDKRKTEEFYARNEGHVLSNAGGRHYWKGTNVVFA